MAHVAAECCVIRARLTRTRLGLWLMALGVSGAVLAARRPDGDAAGPAARLGLLAGVVAVSLAGGAAADRAALRAALAHPATPAGLAGGRSVALAAAASATVVLELTILGVLGRAPIGSLLAAAVGGAGAAAAAVGAALALAWVGGHASTGLLFGYLVFVSGLPPEVWGVLVSSGPVRAAGLVLLEGFPALWRYRALAAWDPAAWAHAMLWAAGGVAIAAWRLDRDRR